MTDRAKLRERIKRERERRAFQSLNPSDPDSLSSLSARVLDRLAVWMRSLNLQGRVIASFRVETDHRGGEPDLFSLRERPEVFESPIAYPRILNRFEKKMDFAIPMHSSDWVVGVHGIPEPRVELPGVHAGEFGIILVPGVVFGQKGERIGRGAGYYDRFLATAPEALRVGIAFDFQVLAETIPQEVWDARMDVVVTESRLLDVSGKSLMFRSVSEK